MVAARRAIRRFGLSGLGRENGIEAVHEYTQTKANWVELTGGTRDPSRWDNPAAAAIGGRAWRRSGRRPATC